MRRRSSSVLLFVGVVLSFLAAAVPADAQLQMFATRETGDGILGDWPEAGTETGLEAGNAICAALADTAGLANPKTFRAWLSDGSTDAWCNVMGLAGRVADDCGEPALPNGGPWVRTDGLPFAHSLAELTKADAVLYVPQVDQDGELIKEEQTRVLTGTLASGVAAEDHCAGWLSDSDRAAVGLINTGAVGWTNFFTPSNACALGGRLLCFESGAGSPLPAFGKPGAWAFVTSTATNGDLGQSPDANGVTGIEAGDEICRAAARRGRLPDPASYVAWLSDSGVDAIDRLSFGGPWRRSDGVEIAATKVALADLPHLSAVQVDELGNHLDVDLYTGTLPDGTAAGDDCGDWLLDSDEQGARGISISAGTSWTLNGSSSCDQSFHLLCFSNQLVLFANGFEKRGTLEWTETVD